MTINSLLILLGMATLVAVWAHHTRISAHASEFALQICTQQSVQMLDQTVLLESIKVATYRGMPCLQRRFRFEFTSKGDRRYLGWVTLKAWTLFASELQPYTENSLH